MGLLDDAIREHLELKRRRGADPAEVARLEQEALGPVRREPEPAAEQSRAQEHADLGAPLADAGSPVIEDHPAAPAPPPMAEPDDATRIIPPSEAARGGETADTDTVDAGYAEPHAEPAAPPAAERPHAHPESAHPELPTHAPEPASAVPDPHALEHADAPHEQPPAPDPRHSDIVNQPTTEYRIEDLEEDDRSHTPPAHPAPTPPPAPQERPAPEQPSEHHAHEDEHEHTHHRDEDVLEETPDFLQETPEHDRLWFEQRPPRDFDFDG